MGTHPPSPTWTHPAKQPSIVDILKFHGEYDKDNGLIDDSKTAKPQPQSTEDIYGAGEEARGVQVEIIGAVAAVHSTLW